MGLESSNMAFCTSIISNAVFFIIKHSFCRLHLGFDILANIPSKIVKSHIYNMKENDNSSDSYYFEK